MYGYNQLKEAYNKIGVKKCSVVLLKTDLKWLGPYELSENKAILEAHFNALAELIDLDKGTIVVPTASLALCNTDKPFDPEKTKSEMGALTEYIRVMSDSIRSYHAFISYTAIGVHAKEICSNNSRHAFGPETPEARCIERDGILVSVGLHPRFTASTVHHIEQMMSVPYRYVKEYSHPVLNNGQTIYDLFYRYVWYRECEIVRNRNVKIFNSFLRQGGTVKREPIGRGSIYSLRLADFYSASINAFRDDIYVWLDEIPKNKPYIN